MKIKISILLIYLSAVTAFGGFGGFGEKHPIRFGKISPSEFRVRPPGSDSAAPAFVLCDFCNIEISNRTFYTRITRIKIMNEEGLRYATVEIPYQTRNKHDDFYELKARTIILENGRILGYKVISGQIEDIKVNDRWSKKKFTFPQVKPGAIVEYEYTVASLDFENLDTWYFQREIPTLWSEIRFQVPPPFVYLVTFENNRTLSPDEEQAYTNKLQWLYETGQLRRRAELARDNQLLYATNENRFKVWAMSNMKKKIIMKNLPGLFAVAGEQSVHDFYPRVRFTLFESSGNLPRTYKRLIITTLDDYETRGELALLNDPTTLPGYIHYRLKTWAQFNSNLLEQKRFGEYLHGSVAGKQKIDSIAGGSHDQAKQIKAIYQFVRSTFRWNGEFSMLARQDFRDFIRDKEGSSAELNLILIDLLRQAEIKADPLLVRTHDLGVPEKMYPVKNQFNHVIVLVEINGTRILLDATSGSKDLQKLNRADIDAAGWIVRKDNPGWIEIFSLEDIKEKGEQGMLHL